MSNVPSRSAAVTPLPAASPARPADVLERLERTLLGKREQLVLALVCLLARGHLLIEDVPGVGKTTLARALGGAFGLAWTRVQFTSDLLPADIVGVSVFDAASGRFEFREGPVFTSMLLADEINRAPPKAQKRSARGDGGAAGVRRRRHPRARRRTSSSSPPRTPSTSSAPTRCPSPSSIAS